MIFLLMKTNTYPNKNLNPKNQKKLNKNKLKKKLNKNLNNNKKEKNYLEVNKLI